MAFIFSINKMTSSFEEKGGFDKMQNPSLCSQGCSSLNTIGFGSKQSLFSPLRLKEPGSRVYTNSYPSPYKQLPITDAVKDVPETTSALGT